MSLCLNVNKCQQQQQQILIRLRNGRTTVCNIRSEWERDCDILCVFCYIFPIETLYAGFYYCWPHNRLLPTIRLQSMFDIIDWHLFSATISKVAIYICVDDRQHKHYVLTKPDSKGSYFTQINSIQFKRHIG